MITFTDAETVRLRADQKIYNASGNTIRFWKRSFDLLLAGLVTVLVLSWMLPLLGLLILLTSPGPVLFIQWRTGRNGRPFRCFKFRTMRHDHNNVSFRQTAFNDARITPIGRWLRRTNLDEMPQFLNVLLGDMSIVGPRPHAIQHDAEFWFKIQGYRRRYDVVPGITGLAQVRGSRGITEDSLQMKHRLRYDLFYIRKQSLWHDITICWWTLKSMFTGNKNAW